MKISKNYRFSEEVVEILDEQDNATEYIENLVMGRFQGTIPWKDLEYRVELGFTEILDLLMLQHAEQHAPDLVVETNPSTDMKNANLHKCHFISQSDKCSHWVHDNETGKLLNTLTGEYEDYE